MYDQAILTYAMAGICAIAFYIWLAYTKSGKKWLSGED